MSKLRDYQQRASDSVINEFNTVNSTLLVLPTGCVSGETLIGVNRAGKGYTRPIAKVFESQAEPCYRAEIPTKVRAYMNDHVGLCPSRSIVYSGEKITVELKLKNGKLLRATPDHKLLTENGWMEIGALTGRDKILCETTHAETAQSPKRCYRQVQGLRYHRYAGFCRTYRYRGNHCEGRLYRVPYHRLVVEASRNDITVEDLIYLCRHQANDAAQLELLDPEIYAVHHIDGNCHNNQLSNLQVLPHGEHWALEGRQHNFMNFGFGHTESSLVIRIGDSKSESTYDVVCVGGHHNFIANGIVAHNCGKTVVFADVIKRMQPMRSLVLAHRKELVWQAHDKIEAWTGLEADVEMGELSSNESLFGKANVIVGTVQTQIAGPADGRRRMGKFDPNEFGLLVLDECFPAGTLVGGRPIETINPGDFVLTGQGVKRKVVKCFKRLATELNKVKLHSGREIICTPNHPILTISSRGDLNWEPASTLDPGDMVFRLVMNEDIHISQYLPQLRQGFLRYVQSQDLLQRMSKRTLSFECFKEISSDGTSVLRLREARALRGREKSIREKGKGVLLEAMHESISSGTILEDYGKYQSQACVGKDEEKQSHESIGSQEASIIESSVGGAQTVGKRRKRNAANSAAENDCRSPGMDHRIGDPDSEASQQWLSYMLQGGCWKSVLESCTGDRRKQPLRIGEKSQGCQENFFLGVDWVESVEIFEPTSDGTFGGVCPDGCVYNLEVELSPTYFADGILVHNCHHSVSSSYLDVINYFKRNPQLKILGVTATPDRADEEALGRVLETVAINYELLDAINDGWLVDISGRSVSVGTLDYSGVRTTAGDLNSGDLAAVMEMEKNIQGIVQPTLEAMFRLPKRALNAIPQENWSSYLANLPPPRRTIVFTVSKRQAEMTSEVFARSIPGKVTWVCDSTPSEQRAEILKQFADGPIYCVVNVGILTEGYDNPNVELVALARATKSRSLIAQMVGRSTRPLTGLVDPFPTAQERVNAILNSAKPTCVVLDFAGNFGRHKLAGVVDLLGGNISDEAIERARNFVLKLGEEVPMRKVMLAEQAKVEAEEKARKEEEARKRAKLVAKVDFKVKFVNPFDILDMHPAKQRGWDIGKQLSEKQRNLLRKQGIDPDSMSYAEGRQMIAELFRRWNGDLCTLGQAKVLKRYGLPTEISRKEASGMIDQLAANGWRPLPLKLEAA